MPDVFIDLTDVRRNFSSLLLCTSLQELVVASFFAALLHQLIQPSFFLSDFSLRMLSALLMACTDLVEFPQLGLEFLNAA
mmetsp:Transcript_41816/g.129205  ORF Transcript_41816/g.129205 Transcript_41816/m.129205 type:complete len:80 (-) Transcript_41816:1235-1474(-)